ncbi:putative F420-dependent enzyme [Candidatus Promineifilum breve]|uniref:F420-dependent enzyme n=1 Tax=Candidatus Promineifilum breve TaxID=1806508 RepID=A0A170PF17_9CHLR|nr:PPOX class F420-dependent oxidoreductase [Candidatus Promineifilum breve]CUS02907.2 putative F420-dependent enzyme [Candidatus Promineifilum breve]
MKKMTRAECLAFMVAQPRTGKIATVRPDGRPHVAPIWFALDGEQLLFTTWHTTAKAANLRHNPQLSLCVDDQTPPFAFVKYDGVAAFSDDLDALRHWARIIAGRYMGAAQAEAFGNRNAVAGELLVRVSPTAIIGETDIAGW